jgi:DNA-binding SARP family transcriptional activator
MQFRILGPLEVRTSDGVGVRLGAEKPRRLLATLLLSANEWVRVDTLIESIWTDPPPSVHSALRTYVSGLRGALHLRRPGAATRMPARISARRGAYRLDVEAGELDLLVFQDLADRGRAALVDGDLAGGARRLEQALDLWRGPALEDVGFDPGADPRLVGLAEARLTVLERWVEAKLALHEPADAVAAARPFVADHPLRERLQGWWMLALYQSGRRSEALASYRSLRERLVGDLGIEPDAELQRLHQRILAADPTLDPAPVTALPSVPLVPRQLPADVAGFTGREAELARIDMGFAGRRAGADEGPPIVTVHGPPGVGKSALAVHAAHRLAGRFPDGQLYADLGGSPLPADPLAVLSAFLRALGAPVRDLCSLDEAAARFRSLTAGRALLVVLDNAADAGQLRPLVPAGAGSAVLVTSRPVLTTITSVDSIAVPLLPDADASRLLARVTGVARIAAEPAAVADLIRLCGGLPLALRIAGARLAARPGWPVSRLTGRLAGARVRLDELQAGDLDVRASFQVSLDALRASRDPVDRAAARAFALLGVLDTAQVDSASAARLLDTDEPAAESALERLVDAQLVASPAPGRYGLTDLLQVFADECADRHLGPTARGAALYRVVDHYTGLVEPVGRQLRPRPGEPAGHRDQSTLDRVETELVNIARVVRQALRAPRPCAAIALVQVLAPFFEARGYWPEWIALNRAVLDAAERSADLSALARAHRDLGVAHDLLGSYLPAREHLGRSLDLFERIGDEPGRASVFTSLGVIHHRQGRYGRAAQCHRASLRIRRAHGDLRGQAVNLSNLGVTHQRAGALARSRACYHTALSIFRTLDDRRAGAGVLTNLGVVAERQGDLAGALAHHEEGLRLFRAVGDRPGEATGLENLGRVHRLEGRTAAALQCQEAALAIVRQLGDRMRQAECLHELGRLRASAGEPGQARVYWRRALAVFSELHVPEADEVRKLLADEP